MLSKICSECPCLKCDAIRLSNLNLPKGCLKCNDSEGFSWSEKPCAFKKRPCEVKLDRIS